MYRLFYPAAPVENTLLLTSVASMSVGNVSDHGILKRIGVRTAGANVSGTPSAELRIVLDGLGTVTIPCWAGSTAFASALRPFAHNVSNNSPGTVLGDAATLLFLAEFRSSLIVDFYVTSAGSAGSAQISVEYDTLRD